MDNIKIQHLHEVPELVPEVAQWIYNAFWKPRGFPNADFLELKLKEAIKQDEIPLSLVALFNGLPVGTINLIENDDEDRMHLKPWLAALWVSPSFRKRRIGSELVRCLLEEARKLKINNLYLETHSPAFYQGLGAVVIEEISSNFFLMSFSIQ